MEQSPQPKLVPGKRWGTKKSQTLLHRSIHYTTAPELDEGSCLDSYVADPATKDDQRSIKSLP